MKTLANILINLGVWFLVGIAVGLGWRVSDEIAGWFKGSIQNRKIAKSQEPPQAIPETEETPAMATA